MGSDVASDWTTFLLRYGELGIKSDQVRRRFEDQLEANLRTHFTYRGVSALVDREWGRFFLETPDAEVGHEVIQRTFGLVHGSPVIPTEPTLEAVADVVRSIAADAVEPGETFAIRARRTGNHDFTSMDVGVRGGDVVLEEVPDAEVDLDDPDTEIHVEVRDAEAYVFTEFVQAPGGLPMGSQGLVVVPIEGPRSPAAAWLSMRRGSSVHMVVPEACERVAAELAPWAPGEPYTVIDGEVSRAGLRAAAQAKARGIHANAVVLGEHETTAVDTDQELNLPVLRPLAGLPGKRWPDGAYQVAKQAADLHPGSCVDAAGADPKEALERLERADIRELGAETSDA